MKTFLFLLGLVAAGIVGYSFEPNLRLSLTGKEPGRKIANPPGATASEDGSSQSIPQSAVDADPSNLPPEQIPVPPTTPPLEETAVAVSPPPSEVTVADPFGETTSTPPAEEEATASTHSSTPVNPPVAVEPPAAVDSVPIAGSVPESAPSKGSEPTPPSAPISSGSVVTLMQSSIKGGEINEFTYDQVVNWEASPQTETFDGDPYQVGIASYKAETVFGVKTIQAKALIKGGKVVKWLWPKSGMDIK